MASLTRADTINRWLLTVSLQADTARYPWRYDGIRS